MDNFTLWFPHSRTCVCGHVHACVYRLKTSPRLGPEEAKDRLRIGMCVFRMGRSGVSQPPALSPGVWVRCVYTAEMWGPGDYRKLRNGRGTSWRLCQLCPCAQENQTCPAEVFTWCPHPAFLAPRNHPPYQAKPSP